MTSSVAGQLLLERCLFIVVGFGAEMGHFQWAQLGEVPLKIGSGAARRDGAEATHHFRIVTAAMDLGNSFAYNFIVVGQQLSKVYKAYLVGIPL